MGYGKERSPVFLLGIHVAEDRLALPKFHVHMPFCTVIPPSGIYTIENRGIIEDICAKIFITAFVVVAENHNQPRISRNIKCETNHGVVIERDELKPLKGGARSRALTWQSMVGCPEVKIKPRTYVYTA